MAKLSISELIVLVQLTKFILKEKVRREWEEEEGEDQRSLEDKIW